jgi:hypothetical protein
MLWQEVISTSGEATRSAAQPMASPKRLNTLHSRDLIDQAGRDEVAQVHGGNVEIT